MRAVKHVAIALLLSGCAHDAVQPVTPSAVCPVLPSGVLPNEPAELHALIVAVRLREPDPEPECTPGEICVVSCEEGTVCAACEHVMVSSIYRLGAIDTDEAARHAAAVVVDNRLPWDGSHALAVVSSFTRMKGRVVPYLEPHATEGSLAAQIIECIKTGDPVLLAALTSLPRANPSAYRQSSRALSGA